MGKPLTIQIQDDQKLEELKRVLGASSKVEVLRCALQTLEEKLLRSKKLKQWAKAVRLVASESAKVNKEFQKSSRLHKI